MARSRTVYCSKQSNELSMCCVVRHLPGTDFMSDHPMSDHPFSNMSDRELKSPSPQQRREETYPVRTALPSKEPSREEIELAQQLLGHAQGARNHPPSQHSGDSPSPRYDQRLSSTSPSTDRIRHQTPGSTSGDSSQREQSYAPIAQSDTTQSGQVCR